MTVEFFGINGFGQVGGPRKTDRPGEVQKGEKTSKTGGDFSTTLQGAQSSQEMTGTQASERAARVQELKEQVQNGEYQPDLQKVASSLLKFLVEG
jgi:negative regulator of flagellin synthesis FlgM